MTPQRPSAFAHVEAPVRKLSPLRTAALRLEITKSAHSAMCARPTLPDSLTIGLSEEAESLALDAFRAELEAATGMSADEIGRLLS